VPEDKEKLDQKLAKFIKRENQPIKYKKRYDVAKQVQLNK
jgi:hypothetical protein